MDTQDDVLTFPKFPGLAVSRSVHYVSLGSAGGKFPSVCRAAVVTEVVNQEDGIIHIFIMNPLGEFHGLDIEYDGETKSPGTWHWPERV